MSNWPPQPHTVEQEPAKQAMINGFPIEPSAEPPEAAVIRLEREKSQLKSQLDDLADAWEGVRAEVRSDCEARERLRARLDTALAETEAERRGRQSAEQRAEGLREELESERQAAAQLAERCERACRERSTLRTETAELRAKGDEANSELEQCRKENASLTERLHALEQQEKQAQKNGQRRRAQREEKAMAIEAESSKLVPYSSRTRGHPPSEWDTKPPIGRGGAGADTDPRAGLSHVRLDDLIRSPGSRRRWLPPAAPGGQWSIADEEAILRGGSALIVRLHRLERENLALRLRLSLRERQRESAATTQPDTYNSRSRSPDHPGAPKDSAKAVCRIEDLRQLQTGSRECLELLRSVRQRLTGNGWSAAAVLSDLKAMELLADERERLLGSSFGLMSAASGERQERRLLDVDRWTARYAALRRLLDNAG